MDFSSFDINIQTAIIAGGFTLIGGAVAGLSSLAQSLFQIHADRKRNEFIKQSERENELRKKQEEVYFDILSTLCPLANRIRYWLVSKEADSELSNTITTTLDDFHDRFPKYLVYSTADIADKYTKVSNEIASLNPLIANVNHLRAKAKLTFISEEERQQLENFSEQIYSKVEKLLSYSDSLILAIRKELGVQD